MFRYLWGWIRGYVVITVFGKNKEQFLNLALQQNLNVYDVEWQNSDEPRIIAKVDQREIGKLRHIARRTRCRFKLGKRRGLPFFCRYLKKRKMLAVGLLIFCVGLYVLSGFIWFVKVTPQEQIKHLDEDEVLALCEDYGVRPGVWGRSIDYDAIAKQLMIEVPELSWVSVQRRGALVQINVAERDIWTEEENNATLGAIWANRKAMIEEVLIKHGEAVVSPGDVVAKGALLVSPLADGRADAIIRGRVWYEGYGECPMSEEVQKPDGESKVQVYLLRPNAEGVEPSLLKLWGRERAASKNLLIKREKVQPRLWGDIKLPFHLLLEWATPVRNVQVNREEGDAKALALAQARNSLRQQVGENNQLIEETLEYHLVDGVCCMTVRWECKEEIGIRNLDKNAKQQGQSQNGEKQTQENEKQSESGSGGGE